jgi:hypothetical protein
LTSTDWSEYNFQHVVYRPKQLSADELNQAVRNAWSQFYGGRYLLKRLGLNRAPLNRGNMLVWALNVGIARIIKQHAKAAGTAVRAQEQADSVFEKMHEAAPVELGRWPAPPMLLPPWVFPEFPPIPLISARQTSRARGTTSST